MLGRHVSPNSRQPLTTPRSIVHHPGRPKPAGWYRDPGGQFDLRIYDGKWTDHVANENGENTYIDPVPR